jgi:hypothetical protein
VLVTWGLVGRKCGSGLMTPRIGSGPLVIFRIFTPAGLPTNQIVGRLTGRSNESPFALAPIALGTWFIRSSTVL